MEEIKTVFLPKSNELDVKKVPKEIRDKLSIIFVREYQDIYETIFLK